MSNPKNQQTLYRFVSLRNPQLPSKAQPYLKFVLFDSSLEYEMLADIGLVSHDTKWEALKDAATAYEGKPPLSTQADLLGKFGDHYTLAHWLARNRSTAPMALILEMLGTVSDDLSDINLVWAWDTLFYQVVTQKSFDVKESIMHILVLHNLKKYTVGLTGDAMEAAVKELMFAKVVLPDFVFDEKAPLPAKIISVQRPSSGNIVSKRLVDIRSAAKAKTNAGLLEGAEIEVRKMTAILNKGYRSDYDSAFRSWFAGTKLSAFSFDTPDLGADLISVLSDKTKDVLEPIIALSSISSFDEVLDAITEAKLHEHKIITDKSILSKKVMRIGGTFIPEQESPDKNFGGFVCAEVKGDTIELNISVTIPTSGYIFSGMSHKLYTTGSTHFDGSLYDQSVLEPGTLLINNANISIPSPNMPGSYIFTKYVLQIAFTNDVVMQVEITSFDATSCYEVMLTEKDTSTTNTGNETDPDSPAHSDTPHFVPKGFGLRQLGIADYRKVVSEICCYYAAEVSNIENIMIGEFREKTSVSERIQEDTVTTENVTETETLTDTTAAQRFEMQSEIAKLHAEDTAFGASANLHTSWGNTSLDVNGSYATNTSKEESNRQSVIQAKDLTQRAMERIVSRVRKEQVTKITNSYKETNSHLYDNRGGTAHVTGVYRFINAVYKNQVYNYGKRLMYEFMVPEPSRLHWLAMESGRDTTDTEVLTKPVDPRLAGYTDFSKIGLGNYKTLAATYGVDVPVYPRETIYINKTMADVKVSDNELIQGNYDVQIPEGYEVVAGKVLFSARFDNNESNSHTVGISFGNVHLFLHGEHDDLTEADLYPQPTEGFSGWYPMDSFTELVNVSYATVNYHSCHVALTLKAQITAEAKAAWQQEVFEAIINGYEAQLEAYNEAVAKGKGEAAALLESNPLYYRQIEQLVLRKNCISYLIDDAGESKQRFGQNMYNFNASFRNAQVSMTQDMDNYTSLAKFMEQAFEWDLISYKFYPFYWGSSENWERLYKFECDDALFRNFMQAGMARVVVTVRPGFEDAVMYYMSIGALWSGGAIPVLGNPLYMGVVEELKEQEYVIEDSWETVLPTSLVALQSNSVIADAATDGLPCDPDCTDELTHGFSASTAKLAK